MREVCEGWAEGRKILANFMKYAFSLFSAFGIDSRLQFELPKPVRYTLLLGKPFPELMAFTIGFWLKVYLPEHNGTIISYKVTRLGLLLIL